MSSANHLSLFSKLIIKQMYSGYRPKLFHFNYRSLLAELQEAAMHKYKNTLLSINPFLARQIRSAEGFSNVMDADKCSWTLPSCIGVIWSVLVLARTSLMAISSLWLPTPAPSCAELLLSLCSLRKSQLILVGCTWQKQALTQVFFHQNLKLETKKGWKKIPKGRAGDEWLQSSQNVLRHAALFVTMRWKYAFTPCTIFTEAKRNYFFLCLFFKEWTRLAITNQLTFSKISIPPVFQFVLFVWKLLFPAIPLFISMLRLKFARYYPTLHIYLKISTSLQLREAH